MRSAADVKIIVKEKIYGISLSWPSLLRRVSTLALHHTPNFGVIDCYELPNLFTTYMYIIHVVHLYYKRISSYQSPGLDF